MMIGEDTASLPFSIEAFRDKFGLLVSFLLGIGKIDNGTGVDPFDCVFLHEERLFGGGVTESTGCMITEMMSRRINGLAGKSTQVLIRILSEKSFVYLASQVFVPVHFEYERFRV